MGSEPRGDHAHDVHHPIHVAPLVVVPGVELHLGAVDDHGGQRIDDGRARVIDVIHRHEGAFFVAQDAGEFTLGGGLEQGVDLLRGDRRAASKTKSVSEAFSSGTRTACPFSLPVSSGKILVMALAEPVVVGISDLPQARARRRSLWPRSTMRWVLVMSWMVVMQPWTMPTCSCITLTTGARQLVVQEAAVTRRCSVGS
jgi:hypothetical protein